MKKKLLLIVLIIFLIPQNSSAGVMEWLFPSSSKEEIALCGDKIKEFKSLYRDARQCNTSADCKEIVGKCPLGCQFYVHKAFSKILEGQIQEIHKVCKKPTNCSSQCNKKNPELICIRKICRVKK